MRSTLLGGEEMASTPKKVTLIFPEIRQFKNVFIRGEHEPDWSGFIVI